MPDVVELLRGALAIPSVSGNEREVAEYLVSSMASFAGEAFVDEASNAVAVLGSGPLRVTFLGHIDTVAGEVPVRLEDGLLYGRGAVDAKGAFCAAMAAAARLSEAAGDGITLTLIGASGEEAPGSRGARHAVGAYPPPDLLIIGEPSGWEGITLGYKGRLVLAAVLIKQSAHSAGSAASAAEDGAALWNLVRAWAEERSEGRSGIFERVQTTLQRIVSADDGLEQRCDLTIGLRLPPWLPPDKARSELEARLPAGAEYRFSGAEAPYRGPKDTHLTRAFRKAIRAQGGTPRFKLKTGTSDMNVVAPSWPAPVVAYGPGDSTLDHTPYEHVSVTDLRRASDVLLSVFQEFAQTPERS